MTKSQHSVVSRRCFSGYSIPIFSLLTSVGLGLGVVFSLVFFWVDRERRACLWAQWLCWGHLMWWLIPGLSIQRQCDQVIGEGPYIIVSNHISVLDIPSMMGLPLWVRVVAKAELFQIPVVGWYMRWSGHIPVSRQGGEDMEMLLQTVRASLKAGVSIGFFPEGSRFRDGTVHAFHRGAFRLAIDEGVKILPVTVWGGQHVLVSGSLLPSPGHCALRLHAPIDPADFRSARALSNATHRVISEGLVSLRAEGDVSCPSSS